MNNTIVDLPHEVWKDIPNARGYRVSNLGRVSTNRAAKGTRGYIEKSYSLKWPPHKYRGVGIYMDDGRRRSATVHRLVAENFVYNPDPSKNTVVRHKLALNLGGDDCADNLEWGTQADNVADSLLDGTHPRGTRNGFAKLTEEKVRQARSMRASGKYTYQQIADHFGVTNQGIYEAIQGKTWKHVI